jgi:REP element-mobilizing transposase RayT
MGSGLTKQILTVGLNSCYGKDMARKLRVQFPGAFYHVITRGNGGQKIFRDFQDFERYLSFLREYKVHFGFLLYAYTLMPTHIHLLLEMNEPPLSKLMQVL